MGRDRPAFSLGSGGNQNFGSGLLGPQPAHSGTVKGAEGKARELRLGRALGAALLQASC